MRDKADGWAPPIGEREKRESARLASGARLSAPSLKGGAASWAGWAGMGRAGEREKEKREGKKKWAGWVLAHEGLRFKL